MTKYIDQMQAIFRDFQLATGSSDPADLREVGIWAMREGRWRPQPTDVVDRFARDMASALRQEYRTDEKGRTYRVKHAVRESHNGKQRSLWADIDSAPRAHMEKAFAQRRKQIVGDSFQLKSDVEHFNDAHPSEPQIQLVLDFTEDVEEMMVAKGIGEAGEVA